MLAAGSLVRAKVRTVFGWKGIGQVVRQDGDTVTIMKPSGDEALFNRDELAVIRRPDAVSHPFKWLDL